MLNTTVFINLSQSCFLIPSLKIWSKKFLGKMLSCWQTCSSHVQHTLATTTCPFLNRGSNHTARYVTFFLSICFYAKRIDILPISGCSRCNRATNFLFRGIVGAFHIAIFFLSTSLNWRQYQGV